jgi:hypothetical protein
LQFEQLLIFCLKVKLLEYDFQYMYRSTFVIRTYWKMTRDGVWIPIPVLDPGGFKPGQPLNGKYEDRALFQQQ